MEHSPLVLDVLTGVFLVAGSVFMLIGGLGLIRLPDVFARMHAAGVIDTLGAEMILVGLMFQSGWSLVTLKLFMIIAFILFTSPTATHALARACLHGGVVPDTDDADSAPVSRSPVDRSSAGQSGGGASSKA